jgi:hypothetical protein
MNFSYNKVFEIGNHVPNFPNSVHSYIPQAGPLL